ncbi:putative protein N(5)-glutamine methyltransferase [Nocardioides sp. Kera G14]|uniref:putative protein N(5)-glutamine methyltransferase n=1 Tax=Nocardioides sp. Kera G14 TaxID=2884264 RepID=UPI001D10E851|nr:putative protein N(5)-glutamine methyltransferase [Nocardioides sp. Kera G14]UDY22889.1 putative protein N(5)-glutamine methyltransferase [Nocardioides sp. Kera G14]
MPEKVLISRLRAAGCVFAEEEAGLLLEAASGPELEELVVRREAGEPLEAILGWAEFDGLRIQVLPGVFVPRQRSLLLVETAASLAPRTLLDLGCGSGALAAAVRRRLPDLEVWATDLDPVAIACARLNLPPEHVVHGDLFEPLPARLRFDVILAHLPYVPSREVELMPREAKDHEPLTALDGGDDGLDLQRRAIAEAPRRLAPGGAIIVASSDAQAPTSVGFMESAGLEAEVVRDEERDATVVVGKNAAHGDRS